ncbi:hypothetical protein, unlikely [Trypanosoma brucei brucei TREU927]|uniref:Uncharacterized protein n=1 Tax=Trypanosoma brucei brucei (strain 927/4 GUTat10.1) TaxID=185431 RepID=Q38FG1_TRYB2|nr:hypothetical protein, unlikely [Trypanosoma brucei brucei TREU927]EAN76459.1 hypothetical protein, unlikely [Trypanosoma brucei brucei TREU927]
MITGVTGGESGEDAVELAQLIIVRGVVCKRGVECYLKWEAVD